MAWMAVGIVCSVCFMAVGPVSLYKKANAHAPPHLKVRFLGCLLLG